MSALLTRLDPSLPICWEDADTIRIGFDRAEARVEAPSPAAQRLIRALLSGVRIDRLAPTLRELRSNRSDWARLTEQLAPALVTYPMVPAPKRALRVGVIGTGAPAMHLLGALDRAGYYASPYSPHLRGWQLVVILERFIELPMLDDHRLASGIPQLLIRFSDRSFSVGPLVEATGGPCLACVTLHDVDADPALPSLAAQLLGQMPATEEQASAEAAAAHAVTLIRHWQAHSGGAERNRWRFAVREGLPSLAPQGEEIQAHPECGCRLYTAHTETNLPDVVPFKIPRADAEPVETALVELSA